MISPSSTKHKAGYSLKDLALYKGTWNNGQLAAQECFAVTQNRSWKAPFSRLNFDGQKAPSNCIKNQLTNNEAEKIPISAAPYHLP